MSGTLDGCMPSVPPSRTLSSARSLAESTPVTLGWTRSCSETLAAAARLAKSASRTELGVGFLMPTSL